MKRLFKVLSVIFTIIMLSALVVLMCMGWLNISGKSFHIFGYALLRVQTGSMAPTYEEGDFLISKEINPGLLRKGDIITFYSSDPRIEGMLNTHRIVDIERQNGIRVFTTKGDAAENADSYKVTEDKIFGITTGRVSFLKWLAKLLSIPWVFAAIVFFPLLLMIISEARIIARAVKRAKINRQLTVLGLDPEDTTVSALADKYGIDIFINAAEELQINTEKTQEKQIGENGGETNREETNGEKVEEETEKAAVSEQVNSGETKNISEMKMAKSSL